MTRYSAVVVDPPWDQMGGPLRGDVGEGWQFRPGQGASQPLPYDTMSLEEITALPIGEIAAPDAHLWLWATNAYVADAFGIARAWGFKFSTLLTWCKEPMGGGLGGDAFGISSEHLLFCRRGRLPACNRLNRTWFQWKRRYDDRGKPMSGAKPLASYGLVEDVSPGPYVEVFSREGRPRFGWDYWGDQSLGTAELIA